MKRFLVFLLLLSLLLLSSCKPSKTLQEEYDELSEKYYELEERYYSALDDSDGYSELERKYDDALSRINKLESNMTELYDHYLSINYYYDELYETSDEIEKALSGMSDIFDALGY